MNSSELGDHGPRPERVLFCPLRISMERLVLVNHLRDSQDFSTLRRLDGPAIWVLPEDYCKKDSCNFNTEMFVSKVGQPMSNSWSTSSRPDFVHSLARRKTARNRQARFCTQSCSKVGQLLVNSLPTSHPMGSCRGLPCSSPLATPERFATRCPLCARESRIGFCVRIFGGFLLSAPTD